MKRLLNIFFLLGSLSLLFACEDPNNAFDMSSPLAVIARDTLEAHRGETVLLTARLSDESGLESCAVEYSAWKVSQETILREAGYPKSYDFSVEITIPADAATSWIEDYQKNDGSIFKITQTCHKLPLTFYDRFKNKNRVYFYIKILSE
ncbi:hypothetical protein FACS1894162_1550 [Bacteroidia bacterium]|nr:hypothetical protein FACS1894162_1550 [Bacteroidia bacterium]